MSKKKSAKKLEKEKLALIKPDVAPELIRKKVDWLRVIAPISTSFSLDGQNNSYILAVVEKLKLNLTKVSETLYRDEKRHIAISVYKKYVAIEFEGQHFISNANFQFTLDFFRWLNTDNYLESLFNIELAVERAVKKKLWHISRLDICHDYLNATPDMFIPPSPIGFKFFGSKHLPIYNCVTGILETIYLRSAASTVRAYRKDCEVLTHKGAKKKVTGLEEEKYKGKAILRFESELSSAKVLQLANDIFNSNLEISEHDFVEATMSDFLKTKYIRKINPNDTNKDRWPKHQGFESLKDSSVILENIPRSHSLKVPVDRNFLMRFLTSFINRAEKENVSKDKMIEMLVNVLKEKEKEPMSDTEQPKSSTVIEIHEELLADGKRRKAEKKKRIRAQKRAFEKLKKLNEKKAA